MSDRIADHLDRAADYIESHGWCQGAFFIDGLACAAGAICATVNDMNAPMSSVNEVQCAVVAELVMRGHDPTGIDHTLFIGMWNDEPERTKQEVLDLLRDTAKKERM